MKKTDISKSNLRSQFTFVEASPSLIKECVVQLLLEAGQSLLIWWHSIVVSKSECAACYGALEGVWHVSTDSINSIRAN